MVSPGVFVYIDEPPQKSVTLLVVHDPVYLIAVVSGSSMVVFVSVALFVYRTGCQVRFLYT